MDNKHNGKLAGRYTMLKDSKEEHDKNEKYRKLAEQAVLAFKKKDER